MGLSHVYDGNPEEAARWFAQAVELNSSSYIPSYLAATLEEGGVADANTRHTLLRQATALNPRFAPAYLERARLHANASEFDEAVTLARKAIELDTTSEASWIMLGQILLREGDPESARTVGERGLTWAASAAAKAGLTSFLE